jgi:hypothetical protein
MLTSFQMPFFLGLLLVLATVYFLFFQTTARKEQTIHPSKASEPSQMIDRRADGQNSTPPRGVTAPIHRTQQVLEAVKGRNTE